jgi:hypothetical protein
MYGIILLLIFFTLMFGSWYRQASRYRKSKVENLRNCLDVPWKSQKWDLWNCLEHLYIRCRVCEWK